jgi:sialate O-acetylesterase
MRVHLLAIAAATLAPSAAPQAPELAPPFTDHAVLQANKPVPIWGAAAPGEHVVVSFAGQRVGAVAARDGRWVAVLGPLAENASGSDLVAAGSARTILRDIVVGEVWLCAGYERPLQAAGTGADDPLVRAWRMPAHESRPPARPPWAPLAPALRGTVEGAFGASLASRLRVPVGILVCESDDGPVLSWMSPDSFGAPAPSGAAARFGALVEPVLPYAIRGILWSQAPADAEDAGSFAERFPRLIMSWRSHLGQGDVPFLWLQLGAGPGRGRRPLLREAQARALSLPATGQAVAIDTGAPSELGRRLALLAKVKAYSIPEDSAGPEFEGAEPEAGAIRVHFRGAEDGLTAAGGPLRSFEVAGADRVFHAARASIAGQAVVASSAQVPRPVAVRYAWKDSPDANLFGGSGLPAAPFRSDDW